MKFWKMSGAGNDFVLMEAGPKPSLAGFKSLARRLCPRRAGIGADGLLAISRGPMPRLFYFNADGSEAFCGNGARCAAWWLYQGDAVKGREFEFAAGGQTIRAKIKGPELVAVGMPEPHSIRTGLKLKVLGKARIVHAVDTGVPHAVVEVKNLEAFPVFEVGRAIRYHRAFAPAGANVNFVSFSRGGLSIRTYERGVEDETLACGTGATASAVVAATLGLARPPVAVRVRGGLLKIDFKPGPTDVWLEGPAQIVFTGEVKP